MLPMIAAAVGVGVAGLLGYAATRPDQFVIERSTTIDAPPEKVFPLVNDFHEWPKWSPWEKLDPNLQRKFDGAAAGRGSIYSWSGDKRVGAGRMEITESSSPSLIRIALDFLKPWETHNTTIFAFEPQGKSTRVKWTMQGTSPFMFKVIGIFMSMDKMVGKDFEKGLADMKRVAES